MLVNPKKAHQSCTSNQAGWGLTLICSYLLDLLQSNGASRHPKEMVLGTSAARHEASWTTSLNPYSIGPCTPSHLLRVCSESSEARAAAAYLGSEGEGEGEELVRESLNHRAMLIQASASGSTSPIECTDSGYHCILVLTPYALRR